MRKITFKFIIALALMFSAIWQVQAEDVYCNDFGQVISDNTRGWDATNFTVFGTTSSIDVKVGGSAIISEGDLYQGIANADNLIDVYKENDFTILLQKGSASFNWIHFAAYADWNADGIFDPVNEKLFFDTNNSNVDRKYTIEVPDNAALGQTRIRIIMGWFIQDDDETGEHYYSPCMLVGGEVDEYMPKNGRVFDFLLNIKDASEGALLALKANVLKAKALTNVQYPIGTVMGTYPQEKWDALQAAILVAQAFVENETVTDEEVATNAAALQLAIDNLNESMVLPFKVSDEANTHWYQIRDMRDPMNFMQMGEYSKFSEDGLSDVYVPIALMHTQEDNNFDDQQLFKIIKAPAPTKGYHIYNKMMEDIPLSLIDSLGLLQINPEMEELDSTVVAWQFGASKSALNYTIFIDGKINKQLNSNISATPTYVGFYYPGAGAHDNGNAWEFVERIESGQTDFRDLVALLATASRMTSVQYPIGTAESEYPAASWDAFELARNLAITLVAKELDEVQPEQSEVDEMILTLQTAIDELHAAQNDAFFVSDETTQHWYTLNDNRAVKSYWKIGAMEIEVDESNPEVPITTSSNKLMMVKGKPATITDSLVFKLVKAEEPYLGYHIYSKVDNVNPITGDVGANFIGINAELEPLTWMFEKSTLANHYIIFTEETLDEMNSYAGFNPSFIGFWQGGAGDPGNNWRFTPATPTTAVESVKVSDLKVYVINRMIVAANPDAKLTVYNLRGQKVDSNRQLTQGVYIVRADGNQKAIKVIVY